MNWGVEATLKQTIDEVWDVDGTVIQSLTRGTVLCKSGQTACTRKHGAAHKEHIGSLECT